MGGGKSFVAYGQVLSNEEATTLKSAVLMKYQGNIGQVNCAKKFRRWQKRGEHSDAGVLQAEVKGTL